MTRAWTWEFEGRAAGSIGLGGWGGGRCAREATPGDRTRAPPRGSRRSVPVRGAGDGAARGGAESSSLERDTETRAVSRARLSRRPRDAHQTLRTFEPCVRRAEESRDARARPSPGLRGSRGCRASRAALVDVRVDRRFGLGFRAHPTAGAPVGAPIRAPQLENQRHQLEHLRATIRFSPPSIRFTPPFLTFNSGF